MWAHILLEEVKAPDGYVLPTGKITIVIEDKEPDGTIDGGDGVVTSDGTIKLKAKSYCKYEGNFSNRREHKR